MTWTSPAEFFAMGGYGLYVWGSVIVSAAVISVEWLFIHQRRKVALSRIKRELTLGKEY